MANTYSHLGVADKAQSEYESLLDKFSGTQDAANGSLEYASLLLQKQPPDTAKAIDVLQHTATTMPMIEAGARAQIKLGEIAQEQGRSAEAQAYFASIAQRTDGIGAEAQYRLGESYKALGNDSDAITALLQVQSSFGSYENWVTEALFSLGECYTHENRIDLARESYNTILAFHHDDDIAIKAEERLKELHGK